MENINPVVKYALIAILAVVAILVLLEIYKVLRPAPTPAPDQFLQELCAKNPNLERCKKLK